MDDDQSQYAKDTVTHLIELLQSTFGDYFKTYFEAMPTSPPPEADYPLVIVQLLSSPVVLGPTQTDEFRETVQLTFVLNRADDAGSANVRSTTMRHLQNLVQAQDPITQQYKPNTVCHAIRTYLTLQDWLINSDVAIKYDMVTKVSHPTLCMANVMLNTWRRIYVPNRQ